MREVGYPPEFMLEHNSTNKSQSLDSRGKEFDDLNGRFVIIASRFNDRLVDGMLQECHSILSRNPSRIIETYRVPGAFEIPAVASHFSGLSPAPDAILCFGVVLQGETTHAEQVTEGVTNALATLQIQAKLPVIHGVGHFHNRQQAEVRCLQSSHNRGAECALAALEMVRLFASLRTL